MPLTSILVSPPPASSEQAFPALYVFHATPGSAASTSNGEIALRFSKDEAVVVHSADPSQYPVGTKYSDFSGFLAREPRWHRITAPIAVQFNP